MFGVPGRDSVHRVSTGDVGHKNSVRMLFSRTFSYLFFPYGVVPSIKMHASERCLRDTAKKGLFFVHIFGLFFVQRGSKRAPNHLCRTFLRDVTEDALKLFLNGRSSSVE
jgi:hypothetical protein